MGNQVRLPVGELLGAIGARRRSLRFRRATWYQTKLIGSGLGYRFPAGTLSDLRYLSADMLADGWSIAVFELTLQEGPHGPCFRLDFFGPPAVPVPHPPAPRGG